MKDKVILLIPVKVITLGEEKQPRSKSANQAYRENYDAIAWQKSESTVH